MSVLIKDMEKPKYCYEVIDGEYEYCPFLNTDDDCVLLLKKGICEGTWTDQYSKCPLEEEPERKGKWIGYKDDDPQWKRDDGSPIFLICSECHETVLNNGSAHWNFCPNCGSYNGGEEDEIN